MMWPYFVMVGLPAFISLLGTYLNDKKYRNRLVVISFFAIWLILLIFRSEKVGADLLNYHKLFIETSKVSFGDLFIQGFEGKIEPGYYFLSKIVTLFTYDFRVVIVISAIFSLVPILVLYYFTAKQNAYLSLVIFLSLGLFSIYFSAIRQVMAIAFVVPAYFLTKEKKLLPFLLIVFFAFLFHRSSLIILLMYPVYHLELRLNFNLFFLVPVIGLFYIFRVPIFKWLSAFLNDNQSAEVKETGAVFVFIMLFGFLLLSYILPNNSRLDKETIGLRNFLYLCTLLQIFAGINTIAMRVNYYYLVFVPLLIPRVLNYASEKNKNISYLIYILMLGFFTFWFFFRAYTTEDILNVYPYIPAWAK